MNQQKIILLFISVSIFFYLPSSFAQNNWYWQNPRPQGNDLNTIQAVSPSVVYAGGELGTILKSTSAGDSWQVLFLPLPIEIKNMQFIDNDCGWVAGNYDSIAYIFNTIDGGYSWANYTPYLGENLSFFFIDQYLGWTVVDSILYKTVDGGQNWQSINIVIPFTQIQFFDNYNGWGIYWDKFYQTSNGGQTWNYISLNNFATFGIYLTKAVFINNTIGYLIGTDDGPNYTVGRLFKTTDGGVSWEQQITTGWAFGPYRTFEDISFLNENAGWASAEGAIYHTHNAGIEWEVISSAGIEKISVLDSSTISLIGCGAKGSLYASEDAGYTWQQKYEGTIVSLNDLFILNQNIGFTAGKKTILKTVNSGLKWDKITTDLTVYSHEDISSIYFTSPDTGWIGYNIGYDSNNFGLIFRTVDGGYNWENQIDSLDWITDIYFLDKRQGWFSDRSKIYKTTDGGNTWYLNSNISDLDIGTIYFTNADTGWSGGYLGVSRTVDGGTSWQHINPMSQYLVVRDIFFFNGRKGLISTNGGNKAYIMMTNDGGLNWQIKYQIYSLYAHLESITFTDDMSGWVVGYCNDDNFVLHTTDSGENWERLSVPTNNWLLKVKFVDNHHGWILGESGGILSSFDINPQALVKNKNLGFQEDFILRQNYPNPFNPSTTIPYKLAKSEIVSIKIYNIIGQEIFGINNLKQTAGEKVFVWNGTDNFGNRVSSGMYIYQIRLGDRSKSRKMFLLR